MPVRRQTPGKCKPTRKTGKQQPALVPSKTRRKTPKRRPGKSAKTMGFREIPKSAKLRMSELLLAVKEGRSDMTQADISADTGISPAIVSTWADALGVEFKDGRPAGKEGKKFSPFRDPILRLKKKHPTWSAQTIADKLIADGLTKKISRQAVGKILKESASSTADKTKKNN